MDNEETLNSLRSKAMALPLLPGVYIMKNSSGEIIYIGKAKALKNRVSQYFGSQNNHSDKVRKMVSNVQDFDYIICDSEFEALILECSLIKLHSPKYNILLKDDKGYSYIKVSNSPWRRISYTLQKDDAEATYIGPYKSSYYVKNAVDEALKIFKLPTCNKKFPQDFKKTRPCLNYHIKQCSAPCRGKLSLEEYNEQIDSALEFLKGGSNPDIKKMEEEMFRASNEMNFEKAAKIRDRILAVKKMNERQKVIANKVKNQDVIAFSSDGEKGVFEVFRFREGRMIDREHFFANGSDISELMGEFIKRYYSIRDDVPKNITVNCMPYDNVLISKWLSEKRGNKVYISAPIRGEQKSIVDMCLKNANERLAQTKGRTTKEYSVLTELRDILGLSKIPEYIESYDISNFAGDENVAGMVVYEKGRPLKKAYRKFKIKSFSGQDDYASMAEALRRRFTEYKNSSEKEGFGKLPDLILLDGGKGQVSAVLPVLYSLSIDVPVFGMVKDSRHRTRAITGSGQEISISNNRSVFSFVSEIQEEVHRYSIGYMHTRRSNKTFHSSLTQIDGIGEKRAKALLKHFSTIKNIQNADLKELEEAPLMTKNSAKAVYDYFHFDL
ncbi:MAG: excinuclease ABC subunit UvrC, partial [Acutalibacteraceae bacterium]